MSELVTVGHGSRGQYRSRSITLPVGELYAVACPACNAEPSRQCRGPLGRLTASKSHVARASAALAEAGAR